MIIWALNWTHSNILISTILNKISAAYTPVCSTFENCSFIGLNSYPFRFERHIFYPLLIHFLKEIINCIQKISWKGREKTFLCFITCLLFLQNMNKTVFIVVRKIVGTILHKWRISGLSQSVSCPFADKQAFSVQFRSMDGGEKICLGDRF